MKTRHKPPSLVSMWMLDVFCCALGCVTLLWLLSTREAKLETARNAESLKNLARTADDLAATKNALAVSLQESEELREVREALLLAQVEMKTTLAQAETAKQSLRTDMDLLQGKYLALTKDRDDAARKLALSRDQVQLKEGELAAIQALNAKEKQDALARAKALETELAKKRTAADAAQLELRKASVEADAVAMMLEIRTKERDALSAKLKSAEEQLAKANAAMKTATADAKTATANLDSMRKTTEELNSAKATIIDLMGQKAKLADKFDVLKKDSESRFAGIAMTGRRVVFLVDMSGSMKLLDDKTPAPTKWNTVVETVAKVMKSIPDLELFQIIVFSKSADYLALPGSSEAAWNVYRGETSLNEVTTALKTVNPDGDTNLYQAMDLAFKLKPGGLDTIYLFSDGLPTSGPGLTTEEEKNITPGERSNRLSKHVLNTLRNVWNAPTPGRNDAKVKINAVGFFFESPEVGAFLWSLSRANNGSFVGMSQP